MNATTPAPANPLDSSGQVQRRDGVGQEQFRGLLGVDFRHILLLRAVDAGVDDQAIDPPLAQRLADAFGASRWLRSPVTRLQALPARSASACSPGDSLRSPGDGEYLCAALQEGIRQSWWPMPREAPTIRTLCMRFSGR